MVASADRLYTAAQVRRLDASAIDAHGIPGIELMERAGRSVFEAAQAAFPEARRWRIFCGGGNNAGDGYVVARLAREAGIMPDLCALKAPDHLSGDAATAARRWHEAGGVTGALPPGASEATDLVVDALLGTGLDRAPEGDYAAAIEWINEAGKPVVAVDIPSGLDADSGIVRGRAVRAVHTVTFIGNKRGLYTADGPDYCGAITYADLETPDSVRDSISDYGILLRENLIAKNLPPRRRNSHKGSFGWLLGIGGHVGMSGAVRLCGEAALRSGAGKVTLATAAEHAALLNVGCPELMVRAVERGKSVKALIDGVDVVVIGTGLGQTSWSEDLFRTTLKAGLTTVIDGDGLNILARAHADAGWWEDLPRGRWILTPHPAEAGRLLGCPAGDIQRDRVAAAQTIAQRFDATVVLKGCGTVVAEPNGRYGICPLGNPGMASAGTGDVLAGVIGALVAQGLKPWPAATTGVVAHARAGDLAARHIGERGLVASDISARLPQVLNPT